ncbi:MAG: DUF1800 domain-containing protein [Acidobacteriota bacterium]
MTSNAPLQRSIDPKIRDHARRARLAARAARARQRLGTAAAVPDGLPKTGLEQTPSLRRPDKQAPAGQGAKAPRAAPSPPSAAVTTLRRAAFGPTPGAIADFNALAGNDADRLQTWVDQQLDPASIDDSALDARMAQSAFSTLGKPLPQLWLDHLVNATEWEDIIRPIEETTLATFLRAIHSRRQLFEVMVDFWHTHFSVFGYDFPIVAVWVHYDRDVIRTNTFGNFRTMLEGVAQSPAMLYYLDNNVNSFEDPNENYARELMELHTMGAHAYYGSLPQDQVPTDGQGRPLGYVEDDVVSAAKCLTGWTLSDRDWDPDFGNTGEFLYHDPWHDHDAKTLLGEDLSPNQAPMKDGRDLLDLLASHPATARFIATKMCRRLVGDSPPESLVDAAAATFLAAVDAPDQIAQTLRTILLAPEFLGTWGDKVRRPFEIAIATFRGIDGDLPFTETDDSTNWFLWEFYQTGQALFSWNPPNGYPDFKAAWNSSSPRVMCWRLANMLVQVSDPDDNPYLDVLAKTPPSVRSSREIVEFWAQRLYGTAASPQEEEHLIDFMAQGHNPDYDLPVSTSEEVQSRLRALVALMCMSPSFLWR